MAVLVLSCDKTGSRIRYLEGTYIGYYHRGISDTETVTLRFNGNNFVSEEKDTGAPGQCNGSFEQKEDVITFFDSCSRMLAFKPSIVLNGRFRYDYDAEGTLRIWKGSDDLRDEYILRKTISEP